jgi:hypothetical protein
MRAFDLAFTSESGEVGEMGEMEETGETGEMGGDGRRGRDEGFTLWYTRLQDPPPHHAARV